MHLVQHIPARHRIRDQHLSTGVRLGDPAANLGRFADVVIAGAGVEGAGQARREFSGVGGRVPAPAVAGLGAVRFDGPEGLGGGGGLEAEACAGTLGRG